MYRSILRQVTFLTFSFVPSANFALQSSSPSRFALLSSRLASTSSKQPTLKERLAVLIPQEIENVRPNVPRLFSLTIL